MLEVTQVADFAADAVWHVVGSFTGFGEALGVPVTGTGHGVGATRMLESERGVMIERLEHIDEAARSLTYALTQPGPLPVSGYRSTLRVAARGPKGSRMHWTASFEAAEGTSDAKATELINNIYAGTIRSLHRLFSPPAADNGDTV